MRPEFVDIPNTRDIAGLAVRTSNARERDSETAALPGLWERFAKTSQADAPPSPVFSVYTDYESDMDGAYTVVLGHEAGPSTAGERTVRVPAGRYAVFVSSGDMPAAVVEGWQQVWAYFAQAEAPERAYAADFEYHDPADPSTVRIYIGVRDGVSESAA